MGLTLGKALRVFPGPSSQGSLEAHKTIAFAGAGGKTTGLFALAREAPGPVVVTSTAHLGAWQSTLADRHIVAQSIADVRRIGTDHITLITGPLAADQRTQAIDPAILSVLHEESSAHGWPLLVEADGSRQRPVKAPGEHEPPIPEFADLVILVAGLGALGKGLSAETAHRPEIFAELSGLRMGASISSEALARVLIHTRGGLKNIPADARRVVLLNQADTAEQQSQARGITRTLLSKFDAVVIAALRDGNVYAVHEPSAGVILAAGAASRFGELKQLLDWRGQPFVRAVAATALDAGLSPVIIVVGAGADQVAAAVKGLSVTIVRNERWHDGQASSIQAGLAAVPAGAGSAVFLLADQPQVTPAVVRGLVEMHAVELAPIVAPLILEERRGNPVLFDRSTFADLNTLQGDTGGRGIFSRHQVQYLPWHDRSLIADVDTEEDYRKLLEGDAR